MIKKKVLFIPLLLILSLFLSACSPINVLTAETDDKNETEPPREDHVDELFGIWVATAMNINFPSKRTLSADQLREELEEIIDLSLSIGANAIFFQVRPSGDAFYSSDIFPVSKYLTGSEGSGLPDGLDPLEYLINSAHERGIAVHAWVNPLRASIGTTDIKKLSPGHPARLHPEYVVEC